MKACLMKLNYDPKYTTPHLINNAKSTTASRENMEARFSVTKQIYATSTTGSGPGKLNPSGYISPKKHVPDITFRTLKSRDDNPKVAKQIGAARFVCNPEPPAAGPTSVDKALRPSKPKHIERHKLGVAKAHSTVKLQPLGLSSSLGASHDGSLYVSWMASQPPQQGDQQLHKSNSDSAPSVLSLHRSKTVPPERGKIRTAAMLELERRARIEAELAMKEKKVFTILGPYHSLRQALRRRGWVEKFASAPSPGEISRKKADVDYHSDHDLMIKSLRNKENHVTQNAPWEEENGFYGMMSYMVRNSTPSFMFTVKSADVDSRVIKNGQLVNHFGKARTFTTKAGLCQNLRSVPWYEKADPDSFYPRCYKVDEQEEKEAFIDDYRLTACMSFIKHFVRRYNHSIPSYVDNACSELEALGKELDQQHEEAEPLGSSRSVQSVKFPPVRLPLTTVKALEIAVDQCEKYLRFKNHDDIDDVCESDTLTDIQWDQFLSWYYQFVHDEFDVCPITEAMVTEARELLEGLQLKWPQYLMDGERNVWILKPGAKSRGRGIQCLDRLDAILRVVDSGDSSLVLQKYIERPLLVYRTKFDIRQWFLVTDWNPLTVWLYKDCYLRFCSQEFTLHNFHVAIHLSNNCIQKQFANHGYRSENLPKDQNWTSDEFQDYLRTRHGDVWNERVVPEMKKAIVCSLLCTQEFIECRKSAFELYGADFMLTEDMKPWLLEINCSPSMSQSTHATSKLVGNVLEDTLKVVLDRRLDKNCDIGKYELAYRQPIISDPPPTDNTLMINGRKIRRRTTLNATSIPRR